MRSTVGVYNTHAEAVAAVKTLRSSGYPEKNLSIIGKVHKGEGNDPDTAGDAHLMNVAGTEVGVGALAGTTLGVLAGIGVLAIPGLGFLYGAGAIAGAIAGFDIGLIGGGIVSALTLPGVKDDAATGYDSHLKEGRFLVVVHGTEEEVARAKDIMHTHGTHNALDMH